VPEVVQLVGYVGCYRSEMHFWAIPPVTVENAMLAIICNPTHDSFWSLFPANSPKINSKKHNTDED